MGPGHLYFINLPAAANVGAAKVEKWGSQGNGACLQQHELGTPMEEPREHQLGAGRLDSWRGRGDWAPQGLASSPSLLSNVGRVKTIRVPRKGLRDKGTSKRLWESWAATGQMGGGR